ncbi:hypothetical protein OHB12_33720 [Nocardia sp. NBC_01730]|uniref:hypothetical protein n=1 Tax=Nocardia sp. NBC_01730 TaxID=2975998 RepID=UPI002E0DC7D6|nr:hypothetical protein OHB12_33720 [Nocardia sp. NBC_01730]
MSTNELDDLYINQYVDKVADPEEVLMRADFARMQEIRDNMPHVQTAEERYQLSNQADAIDQRWGGQLSDERETWQYLQDAHDDWKRSPEVMCRFHEQINIDQAAGLCGLSGTEWRSQQQARELTGHGSWSESLTEAHRTPIKGHAFAGLINGRDREQEMER